jgi:shikimate kinase
MKKKSIALIGFMATGKTTVGKALADYLGNKYKFIETDQLIIEMACKSIPRIFSENCEEKFREYEIEACRKAAKLKKTVISCGGGIVLNKTNIENLKKTCHIVLLTASPKEIYNRAMKDGKETRPVIDKEDPMKEIESALKQREPYYNISAGIVINTTNKTIDEIIGEIIKATMK